jgi:ribokinase
MSQENTIHIKDIPFDYLDVTACHICPMDFSSQTRLPSLLRQGHVSTINLMAINDYMDPIYWDAIPTVLNGINTFICTEDQIRNLFTGRTSDLWEMAEALASYGSEFIVVATNNKRYFLYDHLGKKKMEVPAYSGQNVDPTGVLDSFCGGFLAGIRSSHEPIQAVMKGSISASFTQEGTGPFYCMEALPDLVNARMEALKPMIIQY